MSESLGPLSLSVLILVGIAMLWASRLVYGRRGAISDDFLKHIMWISGWLLLLVGIKGVVVGLSGPAAVLALLLLWIVLIMVHGQYRQSERRALLEMLALAAERNLPLETAAWAFAEDRHGELGQRARRLAETLEQGVPLPEALQTTGHRLPTDARLAVRVGTGMGALAPALRRISGMGQGVEHLLRSTLVQCLYFVFVVCCAIVIVSYVMLRIVPKFALMFEEFDLALPGPTMVLVSISKGVVSNWWLCLPLVGLSILALLTLIACALIYMGWLPRSFPPLAFATRRYDGALVLRTLALAVEQQRSLAETVRFLSEFYPLKSVRLRLTRAVVAIDQGSDWCDMLVAVGLVRQADGAVLKAAQRVGNLSWALHEMADSSLRRTAYFWRSWLGLLMPFMFVGLGMIVCYIMIALMMPLMKLVHGLSAHY